MTRDRVKAFSIYWPGYSLGSLKVFHFKTQFRRLPSKAAGPVVTADLSGRENMSQHVAHPNGCRNHEISRPTTYLQHVPACLSLYVCVVLHAPLSSHLNCEQLGASERLLALGTA